MKKKNKWRCPSCKKVINLSKEDSHSNPTGFDCEIRNVNETEYYKSRGLLSRLGV